MHGTEMSEPKFTPDAKYERFLALIGNYIIQFSKAEFNLGLFLAVCTDTVPTRAHFFLGQLDFSSKARLARRAVKERFSAGEADTAEKMDGTIKGLERCSEFRNKIAHNSFLNDVKTDEATMGRVGKSYKEVLSGFEPLTHEVLESQTEKIVKFSNEIMDHAISIAPSLKKF